MTMGTGGWQGQAQAGQANQGRGILGSYVPPQAPSTQQTGIGYLPSSSNGINTVGYGPGGSQQSGYNQNQTGQDTFGQQATAAQQTAQQAAQSARYLNSQGVTAEGEAAAQYAGSFDSPTNGIQSFANNGGKYSGYTVDPNSYNYNYAVDQTAGLQNQYAQMGNQAANALTGNQGLAMLGQAAAGNMPSAAQIQMQQGMQQALASQRAQAASARGPGALAMAQQQAAGNTANAQLQNNAAMGAQRAQEMAAAQQAYAQQGITAQNAANQAQLNYQQMGATAAQNAMQANMNQQNQASTNWNSTNASDAGVASTQTGMMGSLVNNGISAGSAAMAGLAGAAML